MKRDELLDLLGGLDPFVRLDADDLLVLAARSEVLDVRPGGVLFEQGQRDPWMFFVLEGTVRLRSDEGSELVVEGGSANATRPLAQLQPRRYRGVALSPVRCLRVVVAGLGRWQLEEAEEPYVVEEGAPGREAGSGGLRVRFDRARREGRLRLPSLPAIAMDALRAIDRDDADARELSRILLNDPALTAKLIKAANSPLFHGLAQVEGCDKAIVRLGLKTARQLIVAFALRDVFRAVTPALQGRMETLWRHSTEVAAIAMVLSRRLGRLDPDEAMVAGLLHDIGCVAIYNLAAADPRLADDEDALDVLVAEHRGELGAELLEGWNFPAALVTAAREAEDWWRDPAPTADYADLVIVAQLHAAMAAGGRPGAPAMVKLPAFARVAGQAGLDPAGSLAVLEEARAEVEEARALLGG